ncbi:MAG: hypothetical protein ACJ8D4_18550, partial [Xanthobacteraceae bacterium]
FCSFMETAYPATGPTSNGGSLLRGLGRALPEGEHIWLVSFMDYDLGYFDHETCRLASLANPFGPKALPMSRE